MNTWIRRMRLLSAAQTVLTALRVLATARLALTVLHAGKLYTLKKKGH